jgi:RNA polymerase-binding transcription factor DksA
MTVSDGFREHRKRLGELRAATDQRVAALANSFDGIVEAASGVATDDEHDPEGHTIAWERQQIAGLLDEARSLLADIAAAEQRLVSGRYGRCVNCDRQIASARLEALPAVATCIDCAR